MRIVTVAVAAVISAAAYLLLIPWDLRNRPPYPGALEETTPVKPLGVVALVLIMAGLAFWMARRGCPPLWTVTAVALPPSALLLLSYLLHPAKDANPWPLAWAVFSALWVAEVWIVTWLTRRG